LLIDFFGMRERCYIATTPQVALRPKFPSERHGIQKIKLIEFVREVKRGWRGLR
jgi:hypothetical protein